MEAATARVGPAEAAYSRLRAGVVVSTWKLCTLEIPAICCSLKSAEYGRLEQTSALQWRVLDAIGLASQRGHADMEERTKQAAELNASSWLKTRDGSVSHSDRV